MFDYSFQDCDLVASWTNLQNGTYAFKIYTPLEGYGDSYHWLAIGFSRDDKTGIGEAIILYLVDLVNRYVFRNSNFRHGPQRCPYRGPYLVPVSFTLLLT